MIAGILRETGGEKRVALLPGETAALVKLGLKVLVETGAGEIWLQIGPDMWIAMWTHDDGLLCEWV